MKNFLYTSLFFLALNINAQLIDYELYTLDNGLDVILHQENSSPVVTVSVMYHVGAKDEVDGRTGFAHFFEHLLFEGTKNIERGKWFDIVSSNGGSNNANTSHDRTYYYETFPSNSLELGLWMESERMLHPIINQIGVDTQNEVVKEEKRQRIDNAPYGALIYGTAVDPYLYKKHPYRRSIIGSMEDLDAAKLQEFIDFNNQWNNPNNAVLFVAGDIEIEKTKKLGEGYFGDIPNTGPVPVRETIVEDPITETIKITEYDSNIQIPAKAFLYRTPSMKSRDSYVLQYISAVLTGGKSSRMVKRMVDDEKLALQVIAFNQAQEDYGKYLMLSLPVGETSLEKLTATMDEEIEKIKSELISEREYEKVKNQFEVQFIQSNTRIEGIANSLARAHMLYGDIDNINDQIDIYRSITREEIKEIANKYLNKSQRVEVDYLPKKK